MKKHFFIFVGFVFCGLFGKSAFGVDICSYDYIKNWKAGDSDISNCPDLNGILTYPVPPIWAAMKDKDGFKNNTGYTGNPEAVEAILKVKPSAARDMKKVYPERTALRMAIENCCVKGTKNYPNRTSDIVKIIIKYDPVSKDEIYKDLQKINFDPSYKLLYYNEFATMLDYVRYVMKFEESCKGTNIMEHCKAIENILVEAGVPANEGTDAAQISTRDSSVSTQVISGVNQNKESEQSTVENDVGFGPSAQNGMTMVSVDNNSNTLTNASETNSSVEDVNKNEVIKSEPDNKNQTESKTKNQNNTEKDLEEKQKAYDEARAKEQSTENKLLGGLTTAATGIGGMQLMQGMAEQSADKNAMADMVAYIETMRCTYGDGKQVKAGPEEIELPGANDQELMNLRGQYLALAQDLKERKESLGMKPGIESEVIMDRAPTGLYDDDNIGITGGNYASLYRAQALNSETDQAKIDDAASSSSNRVKGGAIATGAGVVGGITGNSLINGKLGQLIKSKDSKEK